MLGSLKRWVWRRLISILTAKPEAAALSPNDMDLVRESIQRCDVLLVEGRSRIGYIIKIVTRSSWSHSALCIGSVNQMTDPALKDAVAALWQGDPDEPLLVEAEIDRGTVITPLSHYRDYHVRICRPHALLSDDARTIVKFAVSRVGGDYSVGQLLDLARFLIPWWTIIPRRWHSSLFEHNAGPTTQAVCSSLIADAMAAVDYPILPLIHRETDGSYRFFRRNPRLYTPRDFDYSPFFEVIKCPLLVPRTRFRGAPKKGFYRQFDWHDEPKEGDALFDATIDGDILHTSSAGMRRPPQWIDPAPLDSTEKPDDLTPNIDAEKNAQKD